MAKLALAALLTTSRFEKLTQHRLGIHTKRHLLRSLHGIEERRLLLPALLLIGLLLRSQLFLPLLGERLGRLASHRGLRLDLSNLLLDLGRFVFLFFLQLDFQKSVSVHDVVGTGEPRCGTHVLQAESLRACLVRTRI
jgi:hypothetical protein